MTCKTSASRKDARMPRIFMGSGCAQESTQPTPNPCKFRDSPCQDAQLPAPAALVGPTSVKASGTVWPHRRASIGQCGTVFPERRASIRQSGAVLRHRRASMAPSSAVLRKRRASIGQSGAVFPNRRASFTQSGLFFRNDERRCGETGCFPSLAKNDERKRLCVRRSTTKSHLPTVDTCVAP